MKSRMKSRLRALFPSIGGLLVLFLALFLAPRLALAASEPVLPDLQAADTLGADLFAHSGSTGMVLVVVRNGLVFFKGYGETAPNSGQVPTADSVVRLCSLTKIFTTDLLSQLANDKVIALNDPLQRYAPLHATVPNRIKPITLFDLATHTAGLPRELGNAPHGTPHFTFPDYRTRWRWLPSQHLHSTPGSAALYSNVGYDLLGDALQSAARKPYAAVLAERIVKPLRMYQTTYFPSAAQCARLLVSAHDEGPCTSTEASAGSSGLYSTASDMTIWLKYLLGTGSPAIPTQDPTAQAVYIPASKLLREEGLDHAGIPSGIGLGWMHLLPSGDPSHIVEKTGGGAGFTTYIAINQTRHIALFVAATDGGGGYHFNLFKGANDVLLALAGLPPLPPDPPRLKTKPVRRHRAQAARANGK
jgi:D-alanyl-D-alanine-carboxypeptidase/D-alanyl-D-alanine-endopeptidase